MAEFDLVLALVCLHFLERVSELRERVLVRRRELCVFLLHPRLLCANCARLQCCLILLLCGVQERLRVLLVCLRMCSTQLFALALPGGVQAVRSLLKLARQGLLLCVRSLGRRGV